MFKFEQTTSFLLPNLDGSGGLVMSCLSCTSGNQAEFTAEINIHFPGLKNLDKPSVFVFPKLLVCLDCGGSRFTIPETELARLQEVERPAKHKPSNTISTPSRPIFGRLRGLGMCS